MRVLVVISAHVTDKIGAVYGMDGEKVRRAVTEDFQ